MKKIVFLLGYILIVINCEDATFESSDNILRIPLKRMESPLRKMARQNIHPKVIESFLMKAKNGSGKPVPLFKYIDTEFYGELLIGHPGQKFKVVFDTAWANTWVPSVLCPLVELGCVLRNKYDSSRSSTYIPNNQPFEIPMGTSALKGKLSTELFHVGQVNITNQTFAELNEIPWTFFFSTVDGVVGLAFADYSVDGVVPLFYNMIKQQIVNKAVFSFYLNRDPTSKAGGTLMFGGVEERHYLGNFTDVKVVPKTGIWSFNINSIFISKSKVSKEFCPKGCLAYIDTSDNTIRGPPDDIDDLNKMIGARGFYFGRYSVPCPSAAMLPRVQFTIKDRKFILKSQDYIQKINWGPITVCLSAFTKSENQMSWSLGGSFVSRYYVKFDMQNMLIGFADARL